MCSHETMMYATCMHAWNKSSKWLASRGSSSRKTWFQGCLGFNLLTSPSSTYVICVNTAYYVSIFWGVMLLHLLVVLPVKLVSTSDRERSNIMWCTVHTSLKVLALIHIILTSMYNIHTCAAWYIPWYIQFNYDIYTITVHIEKKEGKRIHNTYKRIWSGKRYS